ncbi:hypothetical protein B0T24DRAFT_530603 [Lasiosphaeria ovina]|uniref:Genetic interactor of prohibitins 3, mitochondrial n=1 Tax=Lasiosphaeria ovina TaxID=92902 RepID=A0AAE0K916_9PEZI|nr:hypothetical protein B0T24DRAFT_530603 [Lasiosphaeria ovina]
MQRGRTLSSRWLGRVFSVERGGLPSELPPYLCPAFFRPLAVPSVGGRRLRQGAPSFQIRNHAQTRGLHVHAAAAPTTTQPILVHRPSKSLPVQCSGCGGLSQTTVPDQAGYFDLSRRAVKQYLGLEEDEHGQGRVGAHKYGDVVEEALKRVNLNKMERQGVDLKLLLPDPKPRRPEVAAASVKPPICDRCHNLIHHHAGNSIFHPSIESLRDTIDESPYKYNHVYHVLDAADFPMSILPKLREIVDLSTMRSQNRRAGEPTFRNGRKTDISFIISRSDLFAPQKEQVDRLMPYLRDTLRGALGRVARNLRLGNIHCVSAKRGWWTKKLKEEIWERGGAGWMVGKVNVGKSQLFQSVFPKGRMDWKPPKHDISIVMHPKEQASPSSGVAGSDPFSALFAKPKRRVTEDLALLPPALPEAEYPDMPVVSSLPGTTASPIRMPFGGGKGELIDLPGLSRGELENFVKEDKRSSLIMKNRVTPEQLSLRPGQSLLIGGLIRITPQTTDLVFLSYAFTPIEPHVSSTVKAIAIQEQSEEAPNVETIALPGTGDKIKHAGSFKLRYDVTKPRAGPITRRNAANISVDRLPYRVFSIDILIEGCGWVELVSQVRTKNLMPSFSPTEKPVAKAADNWSSDRITTLDLADNDGRPDKRDPLEDCYPVVDVYSPEGRFIGSRPPMNAWLLNKPRTEHIMKRPRKSMRGVKKEVKKRRHLLQAVGLE